nr:DUF2269 family protein [Sphingomonas telluris]
MFGTGIGTAFFFWSSCNADDAARLFAARTTVRADYFFTLPAVVLQPLTGAWMIARAGFEWSDRWLLLSYALYLLAGLCWLPVVWLQIRMCRMLEAKVAGDAFYEARFESLRRRWFALGWPAFGGLLFRLLPDGRQAGLVKRVLIIGGYGNFGGYIARALAQDENIALLIGGRSQSRADEFAASLNAVNPASGCALDIDGDIAGRLREIGPDFVIHTTGPFQSQDYRVAGAAIEAGAHYCDLADARQFVANIGELDADARAAGVAVIAGASSVPCLTAACIDHYKPHFATLESAV